jgi:hypothetical protein
LDRNPIQAIEKYSSQGYWDVTTEAHTSGGSQACGGTQHRHNYTQNKPAKWIQSQPPIVFQNTGKKHGNQHALTIAKEEESGHA